VETVAYRNTQSPAGEPATEDLTFYITLRRRPGYYILTLTIPAILISFVSVLTFALPTDSNEKLVTSFLSIASIILMLIYIGNELPPSVSQVPLITKFVLFTLALHVLSVFGTTLILHLGTKECEMPEWIREYVLLKLGVRQLKFGLLFANYSSLFVFI